MLKKIVLSAAVVAGLAGSAYTFSAVAAPDPSGDHRNGGDRAFLFDARLAGMKAALKLNADQEKLWTPFEQAVRDAAQARREETEARREAMHGWRDGEGKDAAASPIDRMMKMSDRLAKASEEVKQIAGAAKPLYDSLDDGQKREFGPLLHMLRGEGHHRRERG